MQLPDIHLAHYTTVLRYAKDNGYSSVHLQLALCEAGLQELGPRGFMPLPEAGNYALASYARQPIVLWNPYLLRHVAVEGGLGYPRRRGRFSR